MQNADGYCDSTVNLIVIEDFVPGPDSLKDLTVYANRSLRHEIIHAFLDQSGLQHNSEWARNEEMVDFFAVQLPKIVKAMQEAGAL